MLLELFTVTTDVTSFVCFLWQEAVAAGAGEHTAWAGERQPGSQGQPVTQVSPTVIDFSFNISLSLTRFSTKSTIEMQKSGI